MNDVLKCDATGVALTYENLITLITAIKQQMPHAARWRRLELEKILGLLQIQTSHMREINSQTTNENFVG